MSTPSITGILFQIDSITAGAGLPDHAHRYSDLFAKASGLPIVNNAYVGDALWRTSGKYPTQDAPCFNAATCNAYSILGGVNDILQENASLDLLTSRFTALTKLAKATGFIVIGCTILPFGAVASSITPADYTTRTTFNANLLANPASLGVDIVVDFASIPEAQDPTNTTYYQDGVHPTSALNAIMAAFYAKALAPYIGGTTTVAAPAQAPATKPSRPAPAVGSKLDLTGYKLTFSEEFTTRPKMSVLGDKQSWGTVRPDWQIKPNGGATLGDVGFGNSHFVDPSAGYDPFDVRGGVLRITGVYPTPDTTGWTNWASGLLHTREMFTQCYGYFEARMKLPPEAGTWPAFWLLPRDTQHPAGSVAGQWQEADVVEAYGANPTGVYQNMHSTDVQPAGVQWNVVSDHTDQPTGFVTYGMDWQPDFVTFYVNGVVMGVKKTPTDWNIPMFMLLNLARDGASQYLVTPPPAGQTSFMSMEVDYVRAYSRDPAAVAVDLGPLSIPDAKPTPGLYGATVKSSVATASASASAPATASSNLSLIVWQDKYGDDSQFTVTMDGQQIGGTYTCTGSMATKQTVALPVTLPSGKHAITINFLNDKFDGGGDRNLYVEDVLVFGKSVYHWIPLMSGGPQTVTITVP